MTPSRKERKTRSVFDVHRGNAAPPRRPLTERVYGRNVLNLRPGFGRRHPWFAAAVLFVLVGGVYLGIRKLTTRAEVADFYPLTCLGSWQDPANAQGTPESLAVPGTAITAADAAIYNPASAPLSQIYCGAFVPPDYKTEGNITSVGLTLVWDMPGFDATSTATTTGGTAAASVTNTDATSSGTATSSAATSGASAVTSTTPPAPAENPTGTSATSTSFIEALKPLALLFNVAFADTTDTASTVPTSSDTSTPPSPPAPPSSPAPSVPEPTSTPTSTPASTPASPASPAAATTTATSTESAVAATTTAAAAASTTGGNSKVNAVAGNATSTATGTATTAAAMTAPATTTQTATAAPPPAPPAPDNNFLRVSYSLDGESWTELAKVSPQGWQGFTANIPVTNWDDLKKLQVKVEGIQTSLTQVPKVYLDGMVVTAHYEVTPLALPSGLGAAAPAAPAAGNTANTPVIVLPPAIQPSPVNQSGNFNANQSPAFDFNLNSLQTATSGPMISSTPVLTPVPAPTSSPPETTTPTSTSFLTPFSPLSFFFKDLTRFVFGWFTAFAQSASNEPALPTQNNPIIAQIFDPHGSLTGLQATTLITGGNLRIILPAPGRTFIPGKYVLKLYIWQNGQVYETQSDFSWGVLVVDFDKSIYAAGNTVYTGFAVLDDTGNTICNAAITMDVATPSGAALHFSTADGSIARNATCGHNNSTEAPDYSATLAANAAGTYQVSVAATTPNGTRTITDHFDVQNPPLFDVTRTAPVRIYPPSPYPVALTIKANADYTGDVIESVPSSFAVTATNGTVEPAEGDTQLIDWRVHLKKGDGTTLKYSFLAPDVSPELYKLGPLQIGSWQESRQWQVAADVTCGFGTASGTQCIGFITDTASTSWKVPNDWNGASNTIEVVGGGGGGGVGTTSGKPSNRFGGGGGGGGAYAKITNLSLTGGNSITIAVGSGGAASTGGGSTWVNGSTCTGSSVCASGGGGGSSNTAGSGGATSTSVGTTESVGGSGGSAGTGGNTGCGGGGGAAGLHGAGNAGTSETGNTDGGGGSADAGSGTGSGGAGGGTNNGGNGNEWGSSGSGGGGGGFTSGTGGAGGNYGGGGGGSDVTGGGGTQGIIVITYAPLEITLANGSSQAPNTTIGPAMNATTSDTFTLTTNYGTSSVTSVTTTLSTVLGVYQVQITNASGTTVYGSSTNPGLPTVTVPTSGMTVSTTATTFLVRVKTFPGTFVPGDPPGSDFTVTSTVTGWADSNNETQVGLGSNNTSSIITIDNSAPAEVTSASGTAGNAQVSLSWTNPGTSDFASTIVLRATSTLVGTEQWRRSSNLLPASEEQDAATTYNGFLYVMGGFIGGAGTSSVFYAPINADGSPGTWTTSPNHLPATARNHVAVAYDGYLYVIGGFLNGSQSSNVFYAPINADGSPGTWTTSPNNLPATMQLHTGAAYNGYLYAMGGVENTGVTSSVSYAPINADGSPGTWTMSSNQMPAALAQQGAAAYNGYLYVTGGCDQCGNITSSVFYAPINASGTPGTWATSPNQMPIADYSHATVAYDGYLFSIGGLATSVFYAPINANGTPGTWATSTHGIPATTNFAIAESAASYGNYLYTMGGIDNGTPTSSVFYAALPPRPVHGTSYTTSTTITNGSTTAAVACVVASSSNSCIDTGLTNGTTYYYDIYTADTYDNYSVGVVPTGNPFTPSSTVVSCSVSTSTTAFGTISATAVATSTPNVSSSITCNDAAGCVLQVSDAGSGASPGLYKSSTPTYLIPSVTATLAAGTEGYGIQSATTSAGSGQALILNSLYNKTGNAVGALSTTSVVVASSTGTFTSREVVVTNFAAASSTSLAGSYADTITYSCLGN